MSTPLRFVPPRVALVDPRTGMVSREWYLFFQGVFTRIGGADGASSSDIVASLFEDAGSSETNALAFEVNDASNQYPNPTVVLPEDDASPAMQVLTQLDNVTAELSALREQVSELAKELNSIKQGTLS